MKKPFFTHKSIVLIPFMVMGLFSVSACSSPRLFHQAQWIMGTVVEITWFGSSSQENIVKEAFNVIKTVDKKMNPNDPRSDLAKINSNAGKGILTIDPMTCYVIQHGISMGKKTKGAFDITLGSLIALWGWNTPSPHLPSPSDITQSLARTGVKYIECHPSTHQIRITHQGIRLDLGGIAKGYAVDRAVKVLKDDGMQAFIVNGGGDLYASSHPPKRLWRIGVQDPDNPHRIVVTLRLQNRAIATSGDYEHFFIKNNTRYHHILNPHTGYPARGLRSVSVLAKTVMEADALATALFVMGKKKAMTWLAGHPHYQGILIDESLHVYASTSLKSIARWDKRFKKSITYF